MGQCQYKVNTLQEQGIVALNATTLEPWPIFNEDSYGRYGGVFEDEHYVWSGWSVRFQCIHDGDIIFNLDTSQPILNDHEGASDYVIHTCEESPTGEPVLGNYGCFNAPTSMPTISAAPTTSSSPTQMPSASPSSFPSFSPSSQPSRAPSLEPSSAPSQSPSLSAAPSSTPSASPSMAPSQQSMANRATIDALRTDLQSLAVLQTTDHTQVLDAIAALNQRLDTMETMMQDTTRNQQQQLSNLRGYTESKIRDTQYWVSRAWYYNTRSGINWNDDNIYT